MHRLKHAFVFRTAMARVAYVLIIKQEVRNFTKNVSHFAESGTSFGFCVINICITYAYLWKAFISKMLSFKSEATVDRDYFFIYSLLQQLRMQLANCCRYVASLHLGKEVNCESMENSLMRGNSHGKHVKIIAVTDRHIRCCVINCLHLFRQR